MDEETKILQEEHDYKETITRLIQTHQGNSSKLESMLTEFHPYDLSRVFCDLDSLTRKQLLQAFNPDFSASIFEHFSEEEAISIIQSLPAVDAVKIIDRMESDDAVDLLHYLEEEELDISLVHRLSPKKRAEINKLWAYSEDEIGSAMSNSFIRLTCAMTVREAMKKVVAIAGDTEYISIIYVVDEHQLVGYLKLKTLIIARAEEKIADIMETRLFYAHPGDDKEDVALMMQEYGESSMAIVDDTEHLVGIVTHDDLMDIISDTKSEDYARFAGLADGDIDLKTDTVLDSVKNRLPWLSVLLLLSMGTSLILSLFEGSMTASAGAILLSSKLAVYLPLILDMAGNSGTQSLAVMIRYLTGGKPELTRKTMGKYLFREVGTGILQGALIGILVFLLVLLTNWITTGILADHRSLLTGIVTGFALWLTLTISTILGAVIPLGLDRMKIDPAVASGPFITTITDIIALSIYYAISLAILLPLYL
ncbi:MAG: magnesium transporter [Acholeplasmataceae bacterium]|nr:magnesium transporter [Acholeplasmataceae bacterium]